MSFTLRPYQRACVDACFDWVSTHDRHPLLVIPTGGGKSPIMGTIITEALGNAPHARALVLAHRKELISQNVKAIATILPLGRIGIYSAGLKQRDTTSPIIVAGIQSVAKRAYDLGPFDVICIDEAHLLPPDDDTMYRKFIQAARTMNPHVRFIGLTATPYRLRTGLLHRGENALFTDIAYEASVTELIRDAYLSPLISKATITKLSTDGVATRGGEFVPSALEAAVDQDAITAAICRELTVLCASRKKWLVFCAGVQHAEHVAEAIRALGVPAAAVHGELDSETRAQRLHDFKEGKLRALTSMDVLTTGYDEPAIDAIALLRPTKSTGLYVQMVGRGFRLHPDKQDTLVLDFGGNVARHGPVDAIEIKDVAETGTGEMPTKECPECMRILPAATRVCPECNHEFPPPAPLPIVPNASSLPILSTELSPPEWCEVDEVEYYRHEKEGKLPSLRVEYYAGYHRLAQEWICLEHDGYARRKAEDWWRQRSTEPVPDTVDEALLQVKELLKPTEISRQYEGRWPRIVDYKLPPLPESGALPRACWTCEYFTEVNTCRRWDAPPPEDVQPAGCDAYELARVPF